MTPFSISRLASSGALMLALAACQTAPEVPSTPVRTRAPQGYEKTITHYLAIRIRDPQKNAEIRIGVPEPGACALDGFANSGRGWVVPVAYATRSGAPTGRETININTRQYFFWFLGDTIAGLTPRIDLCPGATLTEFPQATLVAEAAGSAPAAPSLLRLEPTARIASGVGDTAKTVRVQDPVKPPAAKKKRPGTGKKKKKVISRR